MNSPQKANFIATVTKDIDHVQNFPDTGSVSVPEPMDMRWYGVCISQLVVYASFTRVHLVRQKVI